MYMAKVGKFDIINQKKVADAVGINPATLCRIIARKQKCSKIMAYCIVKTIHNLAEIEDYFTRVGE